MEVCEEKAKSIGCDASSRLVGIWGRIQKCSNESEVSFTGDIGGKCETGPNSQMESNEIKVMHHPGGAWLAYSPEGFYDVHVFADPVTNNVCRLMLFPNNYPVTKTIQVGAPESHNHIRLTPYSDVPGIRYLIKMRTIFVQCPNGKSYLRDLQCDYVDSNGEFSSSDGRPYVESDTLDENPIPEELSNNEKEVMVEVAAEKDLEKKDENRTKKYYTDRPINNDSSKNFEEIRTMSEQQQHALNQSQKLRDTKKSQMARSSMYRFDPVQWSIGDVVNFTFWVIVIFWLASIAYKRGYHKRIESAVKGVF